MPAHRQAAVLQLRELERSRQQQDHPADERWPGGQPCRALHQVVEPQVAEEGGGSEAGPHHDVAAEERRLGPQRPRLVRAE
jgi:hypothetical protein